MASWLVAKFPGGETTGYPRNPDNNSNLWALIFSGVHPIC